MKSIIRFRNGSLIAAGCMLLAIALLATGVVNAAESKENAAKGSSIVVDGNHWMNASAGEQRAFLIGIANMIISEIAYADHHSLKTPPVSDQIEKAVADLKLPDIEMRITRWYETHPQETSTPVMVVIWKEIVGNK